MRRHWRRRHIAPASVMASPMGGGVRPYYVRVCVRACMRYPSALRPRYARTTRSNTPPQPSVRAGCLAPPERCLLAKSCKDVQQSGEKVWRLEKKIVTLRRETQKNKDMNNNNRPTETATVALIRGDERAFVVTDGRAARTYEPDNTIIHDSLRRALARLVANGWKIDIENQKWS